MDSYFICALTFISILQKSDIHIWLELQCFFVLMMCSWNSDIWESAAEQEADPVFDVKVSLNTPAGTVLQIRLSASAHGEKSTSHDEFLIVSKMQHRPETKEWIWLQISRDVWEVLLIIIYY